MQLLFTNSQTTMGFVSCFPQSVFKNYDHDENGFICQEDFEKIAASFPFSFCVMDKEKWVFDRSQSELFVTSEERKQKWYM